jgi:exosortase H (IPTLxxWG-CTERM-specific)
MKAESRTSPQAIPIRFVLLLGLYLLIGNFALAVPLVDHGLIEPWTKANTAAAGGLAGLIGMEPEVNGTILTSSDAVLNVKKGCNGVEAVIILAAAVLAFPASWARRVPGLLGGAIVIFGFNLVRVVNLLWVAVHFPARLELFHIFIWQTLMVLISFGVFLLWGTFGANRS